MSSSIVWRTLTVAPLFVLLFTLSFVLPGASGSPGDALASEAATSGTTLMAPGALCPDRSAQGGARNMAQARRSMVCLINFARRRKHLRPYRKNGKLNWSAQQKSRDILRCDSFSHSACGRKFDYWILRSGYTRNRRQWEAGENIALGGGSLGNVRSIFDAWMNSPAHRRAILDRRYADVGVGVIRGTMRGMPDSRSWTLHFGRRR